MPIEPVHRASPSVDVDLRAAVKNASNDYARSLPIAMCRTSRALPTVSASSDDLRASLLHGLDPDLRRARNARVRRAPVVSDRALHAQ
jgi:hypothetical protein